MFKKRDPSGKDAAHIASKPDFVPALYNYGLLLLACQRIPEAERAFREALARSPECLDCLVQLGVTLVQRGRQEDALVLFGQGAAPSSPRGPTNARTAL